MKVYEMTIADIASEIFDKGEDFAEKIFNDIDELEKNKLLEIDQLKQQLAEKDKEIEKLTEKNNEVVKNFYDLVKQTEDFNHEQYKEQMSLIDEIEEFKQNQTQLAIQELEKVRDYAWFNYEKFRNYLNQQIKELKGEKDDG